MIARFSIVCLLAVGCARSDDLGADAGSTFEPWPNARYLALRHQSTIHLDTELERFFEQLLARAAPAAAVSAPGCTGVYPDYNYKELSGEISAGAELDAWSAGEIVTGNPALDRLAREYAFSEVRISETINGFFEISLGTELRTDRLAELLAELDVIEGAYADFLNDPENNVKPNILFKEPNESEWEITYIVGRGDCEAGCLYESQWRVRIPKDSDKPARLVEVSGDEIPLPCGFR